MGKLGIDGWQLFWQMVAFGILVFLLWKFLYKSILSMLDERRERIAQGMQDARKATEYAETARQEMEQQRTEARKEGQAILAQANEMSEKLRQEILDQARDDSRKMMEKAKGEIEADRARSMAELEKQVAGLAVAVSQSVLQETIDEETHRRLIGDFLDKTGDLK
jgi:F-type H+-transporting ATPase subunit b